MDDDGRLFHVVHDDGSPWTTDDLEKWAMERDDLVWCDMEGFYVDEYGALSVADECGNVVYLGEDVEDMTVVWDRLPETGDRSGSE